MYEPQCINIKACKFIKFKYLQLFIIKYINKVIIIKPKLLTLNNNNNNNNNNIYIFFFF